MLPLPDKQSPANLALGAISRDGSKAASVVAEPAAQQQQPTAAEGKESGRKMGPGESGKSAAQSDADTEAVLPDQRPSQGKGKREAGKGKATRGKRKPGKRPKGGSSPAGEPTATPQEVVGIDMAAAKDFEHPPIRATDAAGAGLLPSQQGPAGDGGKPSHTDAQAGNPDTATIGGNSGPMQMSTGECALHAVQLHC